MKSLLRTVSYVASRPAKFAFNSIVLISFTNAFTSARERCSSKLNKPNATLSYGTYSFFSTIMSYLFFTKSGFTYEDITPETENDQNSADGRILPKHMCCICNRKFSDLAKFHTHLEFHR